MLSPSDGGGLV